MAYKFRLTAHTPTRGFFYLDEPCASVDLGEDGELAVVPRDADKLIDATKYHFDCGGFPSAEVANSRGEKLRQTLRFLTAILDFQLVIPSEDKETGWVSDGFKKPIQDDGGNVLNTRSGLSVFPDDGKHFEYIVSAAGIVATSEPTFLLGAVRELWNTEIQIDDASRQALEIMSLSAAEASPGTKFLLSYLALEQLVPRKKRSDEAQALLDSMRELVNRSTLAEREKKALIGSLSGLNQESFGSALKQYVDSIKDSAPIEGFSIPDLVKKSIELRNQIAHKADPIDAAEIQLITRALRRFTVTMIWTLNHLPSVSFERPADKVTINEMEVRIL